MTDYKPKEDESIIYMAQCRLNKSEIYIGKTYQSLTERKEQHEHAARKADGTKFHNALINNGFANWKWEVLEICSREEEFLVEKRYIQKLKAVDIQLLNTTHNGQEKKISGSKKAIKKSFNAYVVGENELADIYRRESGVLKPVINLTTSTIYSSLKEAEVKENISKSTIRNSCNTGKSLDDGTKFAFLDLNNQPILMEGHDKSQVIGKSAKRVKNLVNNKIFDSAEHAAQHHNVSTSAIGNNVLGKSKLVKKTWVFCYVDESGKDEVLDSHRLALDKLKDLKRNKYVAWAVDEEYSANNQFKDLSSLCLTLKIKGKAHVKSVCEGKRSHVEGWRVAYLDKEGEPIFKQKHDESAKKVSRAVICLNDEKVFKNATKAGSFYGVIASQIGRCAAGKSKSVRLGSERLRFAFIDEDGNPILTKTHKEKLEAKGKFKLMHIESGQVFNSLNAFCRATSVPLKRAKKFLEGEDISLLGNEFIVLDEDN
jgi:hypothetical protein